VRRGEAEYKAAGLSRDSSDADLLAAMVKYPKLIERPIVVKGGKAVLGRPPENALALIN
jgi:arsenate reductase